MTNPSGYFKEGKFRSLSAIVEFFEKRLSVSTTKKKNFESIFSPLK